MIDFRDARPDDAAAIARVLIETKQESLASLADAHDRWLRYLRDGSTAQKSRGDGFAILAENDGDPIAFAAYHHTTRWGCDAELQSLYVRLPWQRRGVGSKLLREVMRRLRAEGSRSLCVGYAPENPYKQFYFKHGAVAINAHWAFWAALPWNESAALEMGQTGDL